MAAWPAASASAARPDRNCFRFRSACGARTGGACHVTGAPPSERPFNYPTNPLRVILVCWRKFPASPPLPSPPCRRANAVARRRPSHLSTNQDAAARTGACGVSYGRTCWFPGYFILSFAENALKTPIHVNSRGYCYQFTAVSPARARPLTTEKH